MEADARTRTGDPFITSEEWSLRMRPFSLNCAGSPWTRAALEGHLQPCGAATVLQRWGVLGDATSFAQPSASARLNQTPAAASYIRARVAART
jgi:hypothetical protein